MPDGSSTVKTGKTGKTSRWTNFTAGGAGNAADESKQAAMTVKTKRGGAATATTGTSRARRTLDSNDDCCKRLLIAAIVFLVIAGGVGGIVYWRLSDDDSRRPVASCGGCHCIVEGSMFEQCPVTEKPTMVFEEELLVALESHRPLNQPNLTCNVFTEADLCFYDDLLGGDMYFVESDSSTDESVCALHYSDTTTCDEYHMVTYETVVAAEEAGGAVTHLGNCGACSTTQDLAVYLRHSDLTSLANGCGRSGLVKSYEDGLKCFLNLGFTYPCAKIWMDNTRNTAQECGRTCFMSDVFNRELNGPPPKCELNECLQCDEEKSGAAFQRFAGRTRRGSGILSAIARSCDDIVHLKHEACPVTEPYKRR